MKCPKSSSDDIEKYAPNKTMAQVIRHVMSHINLYAGERIHFHGFGQAAYKSREVGEAFRILEKAMLLKLVYPTTATNLPAEINIKKSPRLQCLDIGMVNHALGLQQYYFNLKSLSALHNGRILWSVYNWLVLLQKVLFGYKLFIFSPNTTEYWVQK